MQLSSKGENDGFVMLLPRWSTFSTILGCYSVDITAGTSAVMGTKKDEVIGDEEGTVLEKKKKRKKFENVCAASRYLIQQGNANEQRLSIDGGAAGG
jgi:hypothetical protein